MDKLKTGSLIANAILLIAVLILLRMASCNNTGPCPEVGVQVDTATRETPRTDTALRHVDIPAVPVPRRVVAVADSTCGAVDTGCAPAVQTAAHDSAFYNDTLYQANHFKAVLQEILVGNRIVHRSVWWADLTPITEHFITKTVTVERPQPLVKVYLGADIGVRYQDPLAKGGIDVAPNAALVIKDRYMFDAGYYILTGQINAGMKVKLSFKRP
ncbi:MAG: hypothetical protein JSS76_08405 [Bacteroidetes bacterium]|nr:hypothetical protein [Bacteroidota bacterium]